jgi:hypothetical protein
LILPYTQLSPRSSHGQGLRPVRLLRVHSYIRYSDRNATDIILERISQVIVEGSISYRNLVQSIGDTVQESRCQMLRSPGVVVEVHLSCNSVSCLKRACRSQLYKGKSRQQVPAHLGNFMRDSQSRNLNLRLQFVSDQILWGLAGFFILHSYPCKLI